MYTIGEVSKMFNLPISTLRYYDKEGLFPTLTRSNGIRKFSAVEIEGLNVIECLKRSGVEIKDIKQFMQWCEEGPSTYPERKQLFDDNKIRLDNEIKQLEKHLAMLKFKSWYYEQAIQDGNEDRLKTIIPNNLPVDIKEIYDLAHS
ncbi:MerR family transcriptional regulator [Macrococcus capreoli]|uniref:MerR family transcriptional regulator n=1 Tax=Macrococcus capreoli TaxID=2982690 RepID=UPI0021D5A159|nr:MerR family transcriptional regulator [Macrococcus sp. TMW 2.2395]MCU7557804.1 MerR family transcriptional regulator [Macrococcus sp. TMW 2.2395]